MRAKTLVSLTGLTAAFVLAMGSIPQPASAWPGWKEYKLSNLSRSDWTSYCNAKKIFLTCLPTGIHTATKVCDFKHPGIGAFARNARDYNGECWDSYWSWR